MVDGAYEYSSSQDNVTVRSFKGTFKNGVPIGTISGRFSKGWTFTGQTDENGLPDGLWKASSSFEVQYEKWEHGVLLDSYIIDKSTGDKRTANESIRQGIQQLIYLNPAFWMTRGSKNWDGTFLEKKKADIDDDNETVFVTVEQMPSFPGGYSALASYIASSLKYPPVAYENGVQGRVVVTFVVEKDGSVSNAQIARSIDPSLDKEALRVVRSMPKWNPGKQSGIVVRVKYNVPVVFRL